MSVVTEAAEKIAKLATSSRSITIAQMLDILGGDARLFNRLVDHLADEHDAFLNLRGTHEVYDGAPMYRDGEFVYAGNTDYSGEGEYVEVELDQSSLFDVF